MRKPTFPWQGNAVDITKEFASGINLVTHRGHGLPNEWCGPVFTSENAVSLKNTVYPIVFSIECSTANEFASNCLAYSFLKNSSGGASSVIAPTNPTISESNDVLLHGLLDAFWPNKGFKAYIPNYTLPDENKEKLVSLGEMLRFANLNIGQVFGFDSKNYKSSCRLYHIIGDPSLIPFDDAATNVKDSVKIDFISVKSTNPNTIVAIYNKHNNRVYRYVGSDVRCKDANIMFNDVVIIIPGKRPYVPQLHHDYANIQAVNLSTNTLNVEWTIPDGIVCEDNLEISILDVLNGCLVECMESDIYDLHVEKHLKKALKGLHCVSIKLGENILESKTFNL